MKTTNPLVYEGMSTPWGRADYCKIRVDGIGEVATASHGGVRLSRERNAKIPEPLRRDGGWYEEDCEWSIPFFFFADELRATGDKYAVQGANDAERTLKEWFPHEFTLATGKPVEMSESHVLREEAFYQTHLNDWLVISAYGDWKAGVSSGMVGVCALQGGRSPSGLLADRGPERWFLVPVEEYQSRGEFDFVVAPDRHQEIAKLG